MIWEQRAVLAALVAVSLLTPLAAAALKFRLVSGLSGAQDAASKALLALSPSEADQVARRDLLSVLKSDGKFTPDNSHNVAGMTFLTPPYWEGTYPDICRKDRVTLDYRSVNQYDDAGKFLAVQRLPVGVEAQALFHIAHLPVREWTSGPANPIPVCDARRAGDSAGWFAADNVADALRGANMFRMAEDDVRAGSLTPTRCETGDAVQCRRWVLSLDDASKITEVEACPATGRDGACYVIWFGSGTELTIAGTIPGGSMPPRITPTSIASIQVDAVGTLSV